MSKKTRSSHKRDKIYKRHKTNKKHVYRKRRQIFTLPGSQRIVLFTLPEKKEIQKIIPKQYSNSKQSGNMIPGLRNM